MVKTIDQVGKLFIVTDIHGELSKLLSGLEEKGFELGRDTLVSAGDLVDRGPENVETVEWFIANRSKNVHTIQGNHERMLYMGDTLEWAFSDRVHWTHTISARYVRAISEYFEVLPFAIEINTAKGNKIGVVHSAILPNLTWQEFTEKLVGGDLSKEDLDYIVWDRNLARGVIDGSMESPVVEGLDLIVHGHTICDKMTESGNTLYMDTGAVIKDTPTSLIEITRI